MKSEVNKKGRKVKEKGYDSIFAKRLRELLSVKEERGFTLSSMADEIKIARQTLSKYRNGDTNPDIDVLKKIATYFNVSADYLIGVSDVASLDADLKSSCKYTGLTELAVKKLHELKYNNNNDNYSNYPCSEIASLIISDDKFVEEVSRYICYDKYKVEIKVPIDGIIDISDKPIKISLEGETVVIRKGSNYVTNILEDSFYEDICLKIRELKEKYLENKKGE